MERRVSRRGVIAGASVGVTSIVLPAAAAAASPVNPISDSDPVAWASGDLFETWTSRSSTTSNPGGTIGLDWQAFYAHRSLTIADGTVGAYGIATTAAGSNEWRWFAAVSTTTATLGSFGVPFEVGRDPDPGSTSYVAGGFTEGPATGDLVVPSGRYFLIGLWNGPFYRAVRELTAPRTGEIDGVPAVTALNVVYRSAYDAAVPGSVPTQLGGSTAATQYDNRSLVAGFRFSLTA